ncbi:MAG: trigger factor, partial [Phycisphaeraceae bacterium]|nr:trigger factor [Phycisphaeraceae bacterium]
MSHDHDHDHDHDHSHDHRDDLPEPVVTVQPAGPARKKLVIEVPAERISAKIDDGYESLQDEAAVPGFRKGRVPLRLIEKRFGKEVRKDVCSQLISEGYTHAIESHQLHVIGEPHIEDLEQIQLPEEGSLSFEVEIEVVPDFELPELKGLEVLKPTFEVTDEQVAAQVQRYCEMYGRFQSVDQAEAGDYITGRVTIAPADQPEEPLETLNDSQMLVPGESRKFKGAVAGILVDDL